MDVDKGDLGVQANSTLLNDSAHELLIRDNFFFFLHLGFCTAPVGLG